MTDIVITENKNIVLIDGVPLEFQYYPGSKVDSPTLVLLHEGLGCVAMWNDFPAKLSQLTGYPVFIYSRQGYGLSASCSVPRPLTYMHIEAQEVLPLVLKAAKIDNHILIGHSDGGSIGLINAGSVADDSLMALITMAPHILCEQKSIDAITKAAITYTGNNKLKTSLKKYHHSNCDCAFWGWNRAWLDEGFMSWNIENFLPDIRIPQLAIQGDNDPYGSMVHIDGMVNQCQGHVTVAMIADCGHAPYKEQTEQCLRAISDFLAHLE